MTSPRGRMKALRMHAAVVTCIDKLAHHALMTHATRIPRNLPAGSLQLAVSLDIPVCTTIRTTFALAMTSFTPVQNSGVDVRTPSITAHLNGIVLGRRDTQYTFHYMLRPTTGRHSVAIEVWGGGPGSRVTNGTWKQPRSVSHLGIKLFSGRNPPADKTPHISSIPRSFNPRKCLVYSAQ